MQTIVLDHFRVLIVSAGHDAAGGTVIDHQMIGVGTDGGLVFCNHSVVDHADGAFATGSHTVTHGMDCLDNRAGQGSFRAAAIFGRHFYFLVCQRIQRGRKIPTEVKEVIHCNTHC